MGIAPMLAVELHLALNHAPVLGLLFATALLAAGLELGNAEWRRAGLWAVLLAGACAWLAYWSGGLAADAAGGLPGISDLDVARHAAAAWRFSCGASVAGAAAAAALRRRKAAAAVLALALAATAAGAWTAHLGGMIRHPELKSSR